MSNVYEVEFVRTVTYSMTVEAENEDEARVEAVAGCGDMDEVYSEVDFIKCTQCASEAS